MVFKEQRTRANSELDVSTEAIKTVLGGGRATAKTDMHVEANKIFIRALILRNMYAIRSPTKLVFCPFA